MRSLKTTTGQSAQQKLHKWQWAKQMEAFRPFMSFAKTVSNITDVRDERNSYSESADIHIHEASQSPSSSKPLQDELTLDAEDDLACRETAENSSSRETLISLPKNIRSNPSKRTKRTNEMETPSPTETVLSYLKEKHSSENKRASEAIDLIFSGYAATIKKFSPRMQINAKLKFAQLMAELELQHEQEASPPSNPNTRCSSVSTYVPLVSPSSIGSNNSATGQYHGYASGITDYCVNAASKEGMFESRHQTSSRITNIGINAGSNEETFSSTCKNSSYCPDFETSAQPIELSRQLNQSNNDRHSITSYFSNYIPHTPLNKECTQ